ncbi:hypothetical protein CTAYLR_005701 [Chrysophaeum taylorii]|uniref:Digalactosyldiacylglycerol synthase n=1 Tax=Chrysophaeum taylorii TaxID=2483200 RepID=A0AAD7UCM0_9STRA|nr:hypothetical protein CTAYLR_005701 [Chrysophaeum taylorii]
MCRGGLGKKILVMTTASVPWLTGTSINALLRAAELSRAGHDVVLFLPWVDPDEQHLVFPVEFGTKPEQAAYVLSWVPFAPLLRIGFYEAKYHRCHHSLYPMGETLEALDRIELYPAQQRYNFEPELVVLEEPEHLNWYAYRSSRGWRDVATVVGVAHTNYVSYAKTEKLPTILGVLVHPIVGPFKAFFTLMMARWMCQAHVHRLIKLSGAIPRYARDEVTCNVHGVRPDFLQIGAPKSPYSHKTQGAYFIGKLVWPKGLDRLLRLLKKTRRVYGEELPPFDVVGTGPHRREIERAYRRAKLRVRFLGRQDHRTCALAYRVLVNPSVTEVLCTTVAEAIAMGKWVVIAKHPSNEFFYQFPSCLAFSNSRQFAKLLSYALTHEPPPLSRAHRTSLTWAAATDRFWTLVPDPPDPLTTSQKLAAHLHTSLGQGAFGDAIRTVAGAGPTIGRQAAYAKQRRDYLKL